MFLRHIALIGLLTLFGMHAIAGQKVPTGAVASTSLAGTQDKKWYYPFEIGELKIRQSNDGTGVIKEVSCSDCDYQLVRITGKTRVFVNGKRARLLRARERAGKPVFIEFDKKTAVVKNIYWEE